MSCPRSSISKAMRLLLKVLLFPVTLALSIVVGVCRLLCLISNTVLALLAFVILVIAIGTVAIVGEPLIEGLRIAGLAWLISPFGLPILAMLLIELVGGLNELLKRI